MEKDINEMIKKLKESPLYAMSLGGRELYHSNFWEWLMKKDKKFIGAFINIGNDEVIDIKREEKHHDLTIYTNDGIFIIENKIKSLATKEQLDRYLFDMFKSYIELYKNIKNENENGIKEETRIQKLNNISIILRHLAYYIDELDEANEVRISKSTLLDKNTPKYIKDICTNKHSHNGNIKSIMLLTGILDSPPSFIKNSNWEYKPYYNIIKNIRGIGLDTLPNDDQLIVEKYCNDVENLSNIVNTLLSNSGEIYSFKNAERLKDIRYDDTYKKLKMYHFSEVIKLGEIQRIINKKKIDVKCFKLVKKVDYSSNKKANLTIKYEYENEKGKKYAIGIQIEEYQFRYFVEYPKLADSSTAANSPCFKQLVETGWFINPEDPKSKGDQAFHKQKLATSEKCKPCNKYRPNFIHQYYKLNESETTYEGLRKAIDDVFNSKEFAETVKALKEIAKYNKSADEI